MTKLKQEYHELWRDTHGFLKLIFIDNEYGILGHSNLYFQVGERGALLDCRIKANDFIGFLDQWVDFKKTIFKKAGL